MVLRCPIGRRGFCVAALLAWTAAPLPLLAAELGSVDGYSVTWDNDLRYSAGIRLGRADPIILAYPNSDDGDRNFAGGLMTNRLDLTSVLDVTGDSFGLQFSLEGWYDAVYQTRTDNTSPATYNALSVPSSRFPTAVRALNGQHLDIGDSFIYANLTLGEMPLSLRLGRQTLLWGESLFFAANGIAAAQAPVDYIKNTTTPEGYSKDVFLPVNQLSLSLQPSENLSLAAYYQLEARPSRLPGMGSYFSDNDTLGAGAQRAFLTQGQFLLRQPDHGPSSGGQFGFALHSRIADVDLGFYALRYNAKYPVLKVSAVTPDVTGYAGTYHAIYPSGTSLYGASFSTYLDGGTVAGEISLRRQMPLVSTQPVSLTFPTPLRNLGYAEGDTLHGQMSFAATLSPAALWDSADIALELAGNNRLAITSNAAAFNSARRRFAASARLLVEPHYFQVLPNLDLSPIISAGYHLTGRSSTDYSENAGTGDYEIGVEGTYRAVWKAELTWTAYTGVAYRQSLADRDFLMLNLERAF